MAVHLVNPSDNSFGTAVITPRWLFVLAAATPRSMGDRVLVDESLEQLDSQTIQPGDVVGISVHTGNALRGYGVGRLAHDRGARVVYRLVEQLQTFRKHGVHVLGSFIFGLPTDKPGTFEATVELALKAGVTFAHFVMMTPFPGTVADSNGDPPKDVYTTSADELGRDTGEDAKGLGSFL
jgi:hypothetical protein